MSIIDTSVQEQQELVMRVLEVELLSTSALRLRVTDSRGSSCSCHVSSRLEASARIKKHGTIKISRYVVNEIRGEKVMIVLGFEVVMSQEQKRRTETNRLLAKRKREFGLDEYLSPCLEKGTIAECHGVAGSGKSYLAATLGAFALLKSSKTTSRVLFVDTRGGRHAADRAVKVISARVGEDASRRALIATISSARQFLDFFSQSMRHLVARNGVELVVVDSLPDLLRDNDHGVDKKSVLSAIEQSAKTTQCPCFLVNQVVADFNSSQNVVASHNSLIANLASIRFKLARQPNHHRHLTKTTTVLPREKPTSTTTRTMTTRFRISSSGITPEDDDDDDPPTAKRPPHFSRILKPRC